LSYPAIPFYFYSAIILAISIYNECTRFFYEKKKKKGIDNVLNCQHNRLMLIPVFGMFRRDQISSARFLFQSNKKDIPIRSTCLFVYCFQFQNWGFSKPKLVKIINFFKITLSAVCFDLNI
jgi:hypothetical protein